MLKCQFTQLVIEKGVLENNNLSLEPNTPLQTTPGLNKLC